MRRLTLALILAGLPAHAQEAFQWVAEPTFQDAGSAHQGVVPLKQGDLWGLMGRDGQWVLPPQFQAVGDAGMGRFPVKRDGKWGAVDIAGVEATPFEFDAIGTPSTYTPMQWQGAWYAIGPDGQPDPDPLPFDTLVGNDGTCIVGMADGFPVALHRGGEPATTMIDGITAMSPPAEGYVPFKMGDKAGHLDCAFGTFNGGEAPYDQARRYGQGLTAVRMGETWNYVGIYDTYGQFTTNFAAARDFAEGLAPVQDITSGKWGYIDRAGDYIIQPQFDQAYSFSDGLAGVQIGDKRGFILPDGTFAATPQFDDFWRHDGGIVPVRVGDEWGVIAPDATDPDTRLTLPLQSLTDAQATRQPGFTLQPSNPHYYVVQDIASFHSIFVSPDQTVMITTLDYDQTEIALWDFRSHRLIRKIKVPEVTQSLLLPDRQIVAAGLATGYLVLLDAVTGQELHRIHPHDGAILDMV
ncbi:MAG: WG repeat-containing protein, partial [Paracoccaceae bacterium]